MAAVNASIASATSVVPATKRAKIAAKGGKVRSFRDEANEIPFSWAAIPSPPERNAEPRSLGRGSDASHIRTNFVRMLADFYSRRPMGFYVTTPIYYVNAEPHLGHAYTTIAA